MVLLTMKSAEAQVISREQASALFNKAQCFTCHSIDKDVLGPAYVKVSARYANPDETTKAYLKGLSPADYLMNKVRKGSLAAGKNWIKNEKGIPYGIMTPNPPYKVSDDELKNLIAFVLNLNSANTPSPPAAVAPESQPATQPAETRPK